MKKTIGNFLIVLFVVVITIGVFVAIRIKNEIGAVEAQNENATIDNVSTIQVPNKDEIEASPTASPETVKQMTPTSIPITFKDIFINRKEINLDIILTEQDFQIHKEKDQKQILANQPVGKYYYNIAKLVNAQKSELIADIGCGLGPLPYILSPIVGEHGKIFAIDTNDEALRYQLNKKRLLVKKYRNKCCYNNIIFHLNYSYDILLPDNLLDKAIMSGVHIFNYDPESTENGPRRDNQGNILKNKIISDIINSTNTDENNNYSFAAFGKSIYKAVKKGGLLYIIEGKNTKFWALDEPDVIKVVCSFGFKFKDSKSTKEHMILIFEK